MKKTLTISVTIVIFIIISVRITYVKYTTHIKLDADNVYCIAILLPNKDIDMYIKDKDKINKMIKYINSINYYKGRNLKIYNDDPDGYITMFDKEGKIIDQIYYYGNTMVYKNSRYGIFLFTYSRLGKMCKTLEEKK